MAKVCFTSTGFPYSYGGVGGETVFNSVDIDGGSNVVACGWSTAHSLTWEYTRQAVITKVNSAAVQQWSHYYKGNVEIKEFTSCVFGNGYIVAVAKNNFGILRIDSGSGSVLNTWALADQTAMVATSEILVESDGYAYIGA